MKLTIKMAKNLKPGDTFSQMNNRFKGYVIKRIDRIKIAGLQIIKIHTPETGDNPFRFTGGTHVYVEC